MPSRILLLWIPNFSFSAHGCRHPRLFRKATKALAVAMDRDDVLFAMAEGGTTRYAVVHLTWRRKTEPSGKWPSTEVFDSLDHWLAWMKADHEDYTWGEQGQ
jgi:hypothetical protein